MTEARRQLPPPLSLPVPFRSAVHGTQIFADQRRFLFPLNGTQICTDGHRFFFSLSRITNNDCCASCLLVVSLSKDALYLLSLSSVLFSLARCGLPPASYSLAPCSSLFTTDDGPLTTDPCLPPTAKRFGRHLIRRRPCTLALLCLRYALRSLVQQPLPHCMGEVHILLHRQTLRSAARLDP